MLINELERQRSMLQKIVADLERKVRPVTRKLKVSQIKNGYQYYQTASGQTAWDYIPRNKIKDAEAIAQNDYNIALLTAAKTQLSKTIDMINTLKQDDIEQIYDKLNPGRKALVTPSRFLPRESGRIWLENCKDILEVQLSDRTCTNSYGEILDSKSEGLISEILHSLGLTFRHNVGITISGYGTYYIDFVIINKRTGRLIFLEHFGMVDDPDYAKRMMKKLECYHKVGLHLWDNFIFTYETKDNALNAEKAKQLIMEYCC